MADVTIFHPELNRTWTGPESAARLLRKSGWEPAADLETRTLDASGDIDPTFETATLDEVDDSASMDGEPDKDEPDGDSTNAESDTDQDRQRF